MYRLLLGGALLIAAFLLWQGALVATSPLVLPGGAWRVAWPFAATFAAMAAILAGAATLRARGRTGLAVLLLLIPVVPVVLGGLLMFGLALLFVLGAPSR